MSWSPSRRKEQRCRPKTDRLRNTALECRYIRSIYEYKYYLTWSKAPGAAASSGRLASSRARRSWSSVWRPAGSRLNRSELENRTGSYKYHRYLMKRKDGKKQKCSRCFFSANTKIIRKYVFQCFNFPGRTNWKITTEKVQGNWYRL